MKQFLQLIFFFFTINISACSCEPPRITEKYINSDFVARVKITKNYKNDSKEEIYKANIKIIELFKGEKTASIYVLGRSDGYMGSSCSIFIPENTELIIYAKKNSKGNLTIGMCSGNLYLNQQSKKHKITESRELDILSLFKQRKINFTNNIYLREKSPIQNELEQFKGIPFDKNYAIYEITFNSNLTIKNISTISGYGNETDQKLIEIIKQLKWQILYNETIPENTKILFGIYYYPNEKENKSFLSQWYL